MSAEPEPLIGIDLGTTNSVVGYMDPHGRPICLPNSEGDVLTPSVVFFEQDGPAIVGKEALKAGLIDPANCVEAVKRDMGKDTYHRPVRGKMLPPAAISGVILHRLVQDAAGRAGAFSKAVVTVPAYFNEPRRKATMDSARMAGLRDVELINEPTAAALAFGYEAGVFSQDGKIDGLTTKIPGQYNLLVYDLGGGTFDVTLMRIKEKHFQAIVCDGDVQLGGRDWDQRLVDHAVACFKKEFPDDDVTAFPEAMAALRNDAEAAKKTLSQRTKAVLRVVRGDNRLAVELTRQDLQQLTADLLSRTRLTCELAMMEAKLKWEQLDAILLVGGSSRMPMVHEMLRELSGLDPNRSVSPDEAVAQGAALYAQMLWGDSPTGPVKEQVRKQFRSAKITDVNSHSLGIVGWDRKANERKVAVLIPKNTPIPHSNTRVFRTKEPGQGKIYMRIVEGEAPDPDECALIGECRLVDLPEDLPTNWPVNVTFAYRRDGRIFIEAEVKGSAPFQVEIDRKREISDEDAENWANELIGDFGDSDDGKTSVLPASKIKTIAVQKRTK